MNDRPVLDRNLDSKIFRDYYYLKEELVNFCRENGIPVSGGKIEIADRIAYFLETGKILSVSSERKKEWQYPRWASGHRDQRWGKVERQHFPGAVFLRFPTSLCLGAVFGIIYL